MKKTILFICLMMLFQMLLRGQGFVSGVVKSEETQQPIGDAHVSLYQNDTVAIAGCITDKEGRFQLENIAGNTFVLQITCVGFRTERIRLQCEEKHTDIGEVFLEIARQKLDEVSVQALPVRRSDRLFVYPSARAVRFSSNSIHLLLNLKLPRLSVDPIKNTVEVTGGGKAGFLINGKPAEDTEVRALHPREVMRVEYIDHPGLRYKDYAVVINYVTKVPESGGLVHLEADHTPITSGSDMLMAKFNRKRAEVGFHYNFTYLDIDFGYHKKERYAFSDGNIVAREWYSDKQTYDYTQHDARLYYSHHEKDGHYFNAAIQLEAFRQPQDKMTAVLVGQDTVHALEKRNNESQEYVIPSLALYYERNLSGKQLVALNLVGTYTDSERANSFSNSKGQQLLSQGGTLQNGDKWSWIGEGIYEKKGGKLDFSAGIKNTWSRIDNRFRSLEDMEVRIKSNLAEVWAELSRATEKWQNRIGIGGYAQYFEENGQSCWEWKYKAMLASSYSISENSTLNLTASLDRETPTLTGMTSAIRQNDEWLQTRGNPEAQPWSVGKVQLDCEIYRPKYSICAGGVYTYHFEPVMDEFIRQDKMFVMTNRNQKSMQNIVFMVDGNFNLWKDYISLQITPMFRYYISRGKEYTHRLSSWSYTGNLFGNYKNWQIVFQIRNQFRILYGENVQLAQIWDKLMVSYTHKQWLFSVGIDDFLGRNYRCNEEKQLSGYYGYHEYTTAPHGQISLQISYTLPFGRKTESKDQRLNNQDDGDGILN